MPTDEQAIEVTELLWLMLGPEQTHQGGEAITEAQKEQIFAMVRALDDQHLGWLWQILLFYQPRWKAAHVIEQMEDYRYEDIAAANERLIAVTSIIEFLAGKYGYSDIADRKRRRSPECKAAMEAAEALCGPIAMAGAMKGFRTFLERHTSQGDLDEHIIGMHVRTEDGSTTKLESLRDFIDYVYEVRSVVVHRAELGGMWPFDGYIDVDHETGEITRHKDRILPAEDFHLLLWRAIFRSFGMEIIRW